MFRTIVCTFINSFSMVEMFFHFPPFFQPLFFFFAVLATMKDIFPTAFSKQPRFSFPRYPSPSLAIIVEKVHFSPRLSSSFLYSYIFHFVLLCSFLVCVCVCECYRNGNDLYAFYIEACVLLIFNGILSEKKPRVGF